MVTAKLYESNGDEKGTQDLPSDLFECQINGPVMHQAVVAYLANQRQGTASTKGRSEVRGGGRKPFRQKGTGRARAGTIRSPIHRGGGVVFGPHPRDYRQTLPKRVKRLALRSSLSSRAKEGDIVVVDDLEFTEPKTKQFAELLKNMDSYQKKVLFVLAKSDSVVLKSARNIPDVRVTLGNMVNAYEVLWADKIVITQSGLKLMEEVFTK
ncbi:MAG: 50S ribosomal protein L4 [Candidatus Latescibacterota bacterium]|nr:MAG: 50S ribosomal protein L4 [Candidatus Latescibacterota bacterium]